MGGPHEKTSDRRPNDTDRRQDTRDFNDTGVDGARQVLTHTWILTFNEYRLAYSISTGDTLLGAMCHYFPEFGKHGVISCHAAIVPSKVGNAEEQRPSCVVHMDSADFGIFVVLAVDGDVLLQARGATVHSER